MVNSPKKAEPIEVKRAKGFKSSQAGDSKKKDGLKWSQQQFLIYFKNPLHHERALNL